MTNDYNREDNFIGRIEKITEDYWSKPKFTKKEEIKNPTTSLGSIKVYLHEKNIIPALHAFSFGILLADFVMGILYGGVKLYHVATNKTQDKDNSEINKVNEVVKHVLGQDDQVSVEEPLIGDNSITLPQILQTYDLLLTEDLVPDLGHDKIVEMFNLEATKQGNLREELNHLLVCLDKDKDVGSLDLVEIEKLVVYLLLIRNTSEKAESNIAKRELLNSLIKIAKNNNSHFDEESLKEKKEFFNQFSFSNDLEISLEYTPHGFLLADVLYIQRAFLQTSSALFILLEEELLPLRNTCLSQFTDLCKELKHSSDLSDEEIGKKAISTMAILNFLSTNIPADDKHGRLWRDLYYNYKQVLDIKRTTNNQMVREKIEAAFEHFSTFIEDGIVAFKLREHGGSAEHVTKFIYGRTNEEIEQLKTKNRKKVASKLIEFSEQVTDGKPITIEMISTLHATYNQGIVPQYLSHLRRREHEDIQFGKRVGVMPKDVELSLQYIVNKANRLIQNPPAGPFAELKYSIEVAKLHNSFLDIHPFLDRNGSTALLFMELLMTAHSDYLPSENRIKNYNTNLFIILNNSLSVLIVNYEHYKISHQLGHYKSSSLNIDKEAKAYYQNELDKQKLRHQSKPVGQELKKFWEDVELVLKNL